MPCYQGRPRLAHDRQADLRPGPSPLPDPRSGSAPAGFRPLTFLPASYPEGPPISVIFTNELSMRAAVGSTPRPLAYLSGMENGG